MAHNHAEQELEQRDSLPTLIEVLGRRTLAPVDLFSFYIYMRDQQRSVDYLDFWLDVSQHMSLCRHYVRELRRSMLLETPDMDKATSKRSSQFLDNFNLEETSSHPSSAEKGSQEQKVSAILRGEDRTKSVSKSRGQTNDYSPANSLTSNRSDQLLRHSSDRPSPGAGTASMEPPRPSFMTSSRLESDSPGHTVARPDLRASAEKILYTFILPGAEREIVLPQPMIDRMVYAIEEEGRDDPEIFDDAKDYVFQAMERDAFPGFLQAKALGNLVPLSILIRLIIGLLSLGGGFWAGYYCILRNISRSTRCWLILPFTIGTYLIVSYQYKLDLIAAYLGFSEYTWMNWSRVREPYVKRLLMMRGNMALLFFLAAAVGLSVLFIFVPGVRF
ncbi:Bud site selection protein, Revert to axial protein 1 [Lithohypha guttulata]|uniref:Bud site selection protein, Revert to axial protein 1 n=1 Tax=Lithohypha guttulata TaxID=1690604 RepID=A0AAN7T892_9EURO|nr:Bud site selection protein, Revert to axial protein 1 [Lithohypha guttulata]KAK5091600.1 Bud site selection protein, Revert to axial protein 1 [Lithohypha guttulata]KAK5100609.1 Bud site selection protein, Revert to axial protein 1 [Lithohypha guttulata]